MKCLYPILVPNTSPRTVSTYSRHYVPCGKCEACVKQKQEDWFVRLKYQQKFSDFVWFVTLTYDDENLPCRIDENGQIFNDVCKKDVQDYHKRLRSKLDYKISFYLVSEYGGHTHRPHYHAIYYDIKPSDLPKIEESWQNGFVSVEPVNDARLKYVTGYVIEKLFVPDGNEPVFNLMSKGLGKDYVPLMKNWHLQDINRFYAPMEGYNAVLPRYLKEKIYNRNIRLLHSAKCDAEAADKQYEFEQRVGFEEAHRIATSQRKDFVRKVANHRKNKKRNF